MGVNNNKGGNNFDNIPVLLPFVGEIGKAIVQSQAIFTHQFNAVNLIVNRRVVIAYTFCCEN